MITERAFPQSVAELRAFASAHSADANTVTLQSGHFLLRQEDGAAPATPWIDEGDDPQGPLDFPLMTWQLGLEILNGLPSSQRYISTLVNDWQYVQSDDGRRRFYVEHGSLPDTYAALLRTAPGVSLLRPPRPRKGLFTGDFFSERTLRNQYRRHVKRLLREGALPPSYAVQNDPATNACTIKSRTLDETVYCTGEPQTCTHEVAQFVYAIGALTKADILINIYPTVCRNHVEAGTEVGLSLFAAGVGKVINVAVPAGRMRSADEAVKGGEISVHIS
jgi:hypothetical protein